MRKTLNETKVNTQKNFYHTFIEVTCKGEPFSFSFFNSTINDLTSKINKFINEILTKKRLDKKIDKLTISDFFISNLQVYASKNIIDKGPFIYKEHYTYFSGDYVSLYDFYNALKPYINDGIIKYKNGDYNFIKRLIDILLKDFGKFASKSVKSFLKPHEFKKENPNTVFIVFGHNLDMKDDVEAFLRNINYKTIVLAKAKTNGNSILENFKENALKASYAVCLYSLDDQISKNKYRARQNVLFEHGYFEHMLEKGRTIMIVENDNSKTLDIPSDLNGKLYIEYDKNKPSEWQNKLKNELD